MKIAVILPGAGRNKRFNQDKPADAPWQYKIELELAGKPVFLWAIEPFLRCTDVAQVLLAVSPDRLAAFGQKHGDKLGFHGVRLIAGGEIERWETVAKALEVVEPDVTHVAIHDAARPLVSDALVSRVFEGAGRWPAVIPGLPVANTLKRAEPDAEAARQAGEDDPTAAILGPSEPASGPDVHRVTGAIDRAGVFEIQTPQVFSRELMDRAYAEVRRLAADGSITDDAGLVEAMGEAVRIVPGEATNLKITRPEDAALAEAILAPRRQAQASLEARRRLFGDDED